ncbi:hypothetical protein [Mariniflexile sp.]|uniref:hypothetical protein n=1 Tax=Mariniflexile sp. TaxID=1979402 RepID=UPI0040481845
MPKESDIKKSPSGLEFTSLKDSDRKLLHFLVMAERCKVLKEKIKKNQKYNSLNKKESQKLREMLRILEKEVEKMGSVLKKEDDTKKAVIGKV